MPVARCFGIVACSLVPLTVSVFTTGCVFPLPRPETRVTTSRRPLKSDADSFLAAGVPREQVLLKLGEPDYNWYEGQTLVYAWTTTKLTYLWAAAAGYNGAAGALDSPINYALRIDFDDAGRVSRWETRKAPFGVHGTTFIDQLAAEH